MPVLSRQPCGGMQLRARPPDVSRPSYTSTRSSNPFVYDDYRMVVENTGIQDLADLRAIVLLEPTRPLINFSYAVDYAVWGLNPFGFHLTNLLLHVLNVVLLFQVASPAWSRIARDRGSGVAKEPVVVGARRGAAVRRAPDDVAGRRLRGRPPGVAVRRVLPLALLVGRRWMLGGGPRGGALTVLCWMCGARQQRSRRRCFRSSC